MNFVRTTVFVLTLIAFTTPGPVAAASDVEAGLLAVHSLGDLNGRALACAEMQVAARAKSLMLAHSPKTERFGDAYQNATQNAYEIQTRSNGPCLSAIDMTAQLNEVASRLNDMLPIRVEAK